MKLVKAVYWRLYIIRLSFRWIGKANLGNKVIYKNGVWTIYNASQNYSLMRQDLDVGKSHVTNVKREEFKLMGGFKEGCFSFRSAYRFYMTSWYRIWWEQGIKDWMRGCNIWGKCQ